MKQFFKIAVGAHEIPIDADELTKAAQALASGKQGILVLKQGIVNLAGRPHIVPDEKRRERYEATPYADEKAREKELPDALGQIRKELVAVIGGPELLDHPAERTGARALGSPQTGHSSAGEAKRGQDEQTPA